MPGQFHHERDAAYSAMTSPACRPWRRLVVALAFALAAATSSVAAYAAPAAAHVSPAGVPALSDGMLTPEFWIRRAPAANAILLDARQVAAQRARAFGADGGLVDLHAVQPVLTQQEVRGWIEAAQQTPIKALVDVDGKPVTADMLEPLRRNAALDAVPGETQARYGLSVRRTPLRTLSSDRQFFSAADQCDYESLQAGVLFPGEPLIIGHYSADGQWLLVMTMQGPGWVRHADVAEGKAQAVFDYVARPPGLGGHWRPGAHRFHARSP